MSLYYCSHCGLPDYEHPRFDHVFKNALGGPTAYAIAAKKKAMAEAADKKASDDAKLGSICKCGLAKTYHPEFGNQGFGNMTDGHKYKPRYPQKTDKRPYADLSGSELNATLGRALGTPGGYVEATAFGDTSRTYLLGSPKDALVATTNATMKDAYGDLITTSNTVRVASTGQEFVLEDTYQWNEGGKPTRIAATKVIEGGLKPESDIVWLKRRIAEICWVPV